MRVLDLFSGIGGFSLGLERAGMKTVAFCEIDPYCRKVLRKHWPNVPIYEDVRTLSDKTLIADGIEVDLICGGFPCQDISIAGKNAGIDGKWSGLWKEYARIIGEVRPRYVIVENVAALLGRGLEQILGDLAAFGFDAEWHCIPASAVGAPHRRDRIWIVGYSNSNTARGDSRTILRKKEESRSQGKENGHLSHRFSDAGQNLAYTKQSRLEGKAREGMPKSWGASVQFASGDWWKFEPNVGRVADGVSARVDRLKALGNAVVPQIPEIIGRAILTQEGCNDSRRDDPRSQGYP